MRNPVGKQKITNSGLPIFGESPIVVCMPKRNYLSEWRIFRGLSQDQLAEKIGVTPPTISRWENGVNGIRSKNLDAVAEALGCTAADLLSRDPSKEFDSEFFKLYESLAVEDRKKALAIIKVHFAA